MLRNVKNGEYGLEGEVYFKLFDKYISFSTDEATIDYVEKCANYLNLLNEEVINSLCEASLRYRNDFCDMIGKKPKKLKNSRDILKQIDPISLSIPNPQNGDEPVIDLELNCNWEEEHGMEWIIRDNKVLYVGAYNGEDPWGDFSSEDEYNYAYIGSD